ncbi:MAG: class I SAM-dependent methyltransferase [Thermodesulfovibrionales bacterium]|jgi:cephalosporin hydroxylase
MSDYHGEDNVDIAPHMETLERYAEKAAFILEIGCGAGNGSCRAFRRGLAKSQVPPELKLHISIDINSEHPAYDRPTEPYWYKVSGDSRSQEAFNKVLDTVANYSLGDRTPDIIFIDTDHTYEQMQLELELWDRLAGPNTIWLFHDTWMGGPYNHMTDAIKEFAAAHGLVYKDLSKASHGLGWMGRDNG